YTPMQCGLLTRNFDIRRLADNHSRHGSNEFKEPNLGINLEFADDLRPIADKYGKTVAQLVIAWTLRLDVVTAAIVGARRPSQIEETAGGAGWKIDDDDLLKIEELLKLRNNKIEAAEGYKGG
ncbi:MAG: aldo/keto reductase, partial [Calditrichaeota bacterium]|nr:aldo/keto reductase [Calditrichota bacterium]